MADEIDFDINQVVWARMKGSIPWPAQISDTPMEYLTKPVAKKNVCVKFLGGNQIGFVPPNNIHPWLDYRNRYGNRDRPPKQFLAAVKEGDSLLNEKTRGSPSTSSVKKGYRESRVDGSDDELFPPASNASKNKHVQKKRASATRQRKSSIESTDTKKQKTAQMVYDFEEAEILINPVKSLSKKKSVNSNSDGDLMIGVIGMGQISTALITVLSRAGYKLTVWNRTKSQSLLLTKSLKPAAIYIASTPAELVLKSDVIFSALSDDYAVKSTMFSDMGIMEAITPGKGYVEFSVIEPETVQDCERLMKDAQGQYLGVSIIGTSDQIIEGEVNLLASGSKELFDRCDDCWKLFSKSPQFLGKTCYSTYLMLTISLLKANLTAAVSETLSFAETTGVHADVLLNTIKSCQSSILNPHYILQEMIAGSHKEGESLQNLQKDVKVAINVADYLDTTLPVSAASNEVFKKAKSMGIKKPSATAVISATRKSNKKTS